MATITPITTIRIMIMPAMRTGRAASTIMPGMTTITLVTTIPIMTMPGMFMDPIASTIMLIAITRSTVVQDKIALRLVTSSRLRRLARNRPAFASPAWIARAVRQKSTQLCAGCRMSLT
jgi:hypothetical protein